MLGKLDSVSIMFSKAHFELVLQIGHRTRRSISGKSKSVKTTSELVLVLEYLQISIFRYGLEFETSVVGTCYEVLKLFIRPMNMSLLDCDGTWYMLVLLLHLFAELLLRFSHTMRNNG